MGRYRSIRVAVTNARASDVSRSISIHTFVTTMSEVNNKLQIGWIGLVSYAAIITLTNLAFSR